MQKKLLFLIVSLGAAYVSPRESLGQLSNNGTYINASDGTILKISSKRGDVQGSPFLSETWSSGKVLTSSGKYLDIARMKFNILNNRIEFEVSGNLYEVLVPHHEFFINTPTEEGIFKVLHFKNNYPPIDEQNKKSFYEVVHSGATQLLVHRQVRVSEYAEPLSLERKKHLTQFSIPYLYFSKSEMIVRITKKQSDLIATFSDKGEVISKFMKDNKFRKNLTQDQIKSVCEFYDTLE